MAAFQTIGPMAISRMRIRGLGPIRPVTGSGNDLTNLDETCIKSGYYLPAHLTYMYAMMKITARAIGDSTSEKSTVLQPARSTSPINFSEGCPSLFFLYPVTMVRESRQYPIHELECERELPLAIHRRNSR